jgi:putative MATE family efflux protein
MSEQTQSNRLETENLGRLLASLAVPSIIAQVVNILYNIVDRIYIGRMENGTLAMSAISIALPIVTFIMAVTNLLGMGGAPLAAIRLGQRNQKGAEKILTTSFVALLVSGVILTAIIQIFHIPLLKAFGADDSNLAMAAEYITIYAVGTIFVQIAFGMNPYINTQGFATYGMMTVLIGAILNIILDPLFIFVLNMGVRGAALATILSQMVSAVWALMFLFGKKSTIKIRREYLIPEIRVLGSICALGVSPFIMNSTESLLQIAFNNQLSLYGGTLAVGTMSILQSMFQMVSMPLQGLCQGAQPIMSFNYGAKNMKRVRDTFRLLFICCLSVSVLGLGTIIIFSEKFASIFTNDPDLIRMAGWALRVYLFGAMIFGMQIACQQSFVALGQAGRSLLMALYRKILLLIPLIFILPALIGSSSFAMNMAEPVADLLYDPGRVFSVLFAETIADALAAMTTATLFFSFYRKHLK